MSKKEDRGEGLEASERWRWRRRGGDWETEKRKRVKRWRRVNDTRRLAESSCRFEIGARPTLGSSMVAQPAR